MVFDLYVDGKLQKRGMESREGADRYALFMMSLRHVRWCRVVPREVKA